MSFAKQIIRHTILMSEMGIPLKDSRKVTAFLQGFFSVEVLKPPRWLDDSLILKINRIKPLVLKIHEDKYPLAAHIYNKRPEALFETGYVAQLVDTWVIEQEGKMYRFVLYEYVEGVSLGEAVKGASEAQIGEYRRLLKECVASLLKVGVNVFVRDLDDFIITTDDLGNRKVVLTDFNAILDCSLASSYSRIHVMDIVSSIIDIVVTPDYRPFRSHRPTMLFREEDDQKVDMRM